MQIYVVCLLFYDSKLIIVVDKTRNLRTSSWALGTDLFLFSDILQTKQIY